MTASLSQTPEPSLAPSQEDPLTNGKTLVAIFVDFDNAVSTARDHGFSISFARLRALPRKFGDVVFAFTFLSPSSNEPATIAQLDKAGFRAICCPYARKHVDAVDTILIDTAKSLIDHSTVTLFLIISADQDFRNLPTYAADKGKEVRVLNPRDYRDAIEGNDISPTLGFSERVQRFTRVIHSIEAGKEQLNEQVEAEFLQYLIRKIATAHLPPQPSFRMLSTSVWEEGSKKWNQRFSAENLREALTACVNTRVIIKTETSDITFYNLNPHHPVVIRTIGAPL